MSISVTKFGFANIATFIRSRQVQCDDWTGSTSPVSLNSQILSQPRTKQVQMTSVLRSIVFFAVALASFENWCPVAGAEDVVVNDASELSQTLRRLKPGMTLRIAPGEYPGGHYVSGVERLTMEALEPTDPPHFKGGANAWHFSRCNDLTLRHLRLSGQTGNGLNLDDGGDFDRPATGITVEHVEISDVGPKGNCDGIKCSGLDRFTIRNCVITGWGGQGVDMVGCHDGVIRHCQFIGKPGFTASAGVQTKGGSSRVLIEHCRFVNAGERPLNIGGSTGLNLFRPVDAKYEAKQIVARNNRIEGGSCAAAFVGVDGAEFTGNTILYPEKWIFRILQETTDAGYSRTRNVIIKENRIAFRSSQVQIEINIGGGTEPETFQFTSNHWLAEDNPQASRPQLPTTETGGKYGSEKH